MKILVIQGPNLNLLGHRDPRIYGPLTLDQIHENMNTFAKQNNIQLEFFQSNFEGEIVDKLQECVGGEYDGVLINPAAYAHTSIAIADAIMACGVPVVEAHISNIFAREDYRQKSYTAAVCAGVVVGFGAYGYHMGLIALGQIITEVQAFKAQEAQQNAKK
ncbi:type II 3-dehydroquinate dehydratase [Helicobacter sp. CLO-3]|uniref:type II 3-dehydroquinate dehydratase n=1 Tax=unclassified Helicobacter TaxID=2593540 RepID=UPI000804F921|nr:MULTISPECIES: type II 3-dehydroquinate dehydratase [unclassified Helicobacter]OBV29188.1 type II 3-dehydroquinate dehydratase [Helicobacter sp. CLO-3]OHU84019.1 type II 3-dehydroquinate dehydratase [Helicobacter sp. CLO-3]